MNETENVSRRQFLSGGVSVLLGGLLGGLAGHVTADSRLKEEANSAASAPEEEWDRLPIDVLTGAILDPDPKSDRFGGSLVNKTGRLTQYIHVYPGLEVKLSRPTAEGERVCWMGYDGGLSKAALLADSRTGEEDGEAYTVLTIPEGIAFLRGSSRDGESQPEVRVKSLAEYSLRCGLGRPDLSEYTEFTGLTLYSCSRYEDVSTLEPRISACPAMGDVFYSPIGTDIIVTFRDANIAPFLYGADNWVASERRKGRFSRCCGFGYAWYHCRTTEVCSWLGACYETLSGFARMLTPEELLAADPHFYVRFPGRAVRTGEASRVRAKGIGNNYRRHFTVVHVTDTHGDMDSTHAALEYAGQIGADLVAMTGDYVAFHPDHGFNMLHSLIRDSRTPTVYTLGNHDVKDYSDEEIYKRAIAPIREVLQASEEHPYYYRDFLYEGETVRVISLYPFDDRAKERIDGYYTQEQLEWLCEALASVPDGGHILILRHFFHHKPVPRDYNHSMFYDYADSMSDAENLLLNMDEDPVPAIVDAYRKRESIYAQYTGRLADENTETVTVDYDFSGCPNSEFVAYLTGHVHVDAIGYARGAKTYQAVLSSLCTTGIKGNEEYSLYADSQSARDYGTDSQIAFNVFSIDFRSKNIYVARVGNGIYGDGEKTWMELPY